MSKGNQHIDDKFRDAFRDWEADYTPSEMNADWDAFSKNIPQPQQPNVPNNPVAKSPFAGQAGAGAAKILGLSTVAGLVITAATILLYNSDEKNNTDNLADAATQTEISITPNQEETEQAKTISTAKPAATLPEKIKAEQQTEAKAKIKNNKNNINNRNNARPQRTNSGNGATGTNKSSFTQSKDITSTAANVNNAEPASTNRNDANNIAAAGQPKEVTELNDTSICLSTALRIYNKNKNAEMRVNWGNGQTAVTTKAEASYIYTKEGLYDVKVEYKDQVIQRRLKVHAKPEAHFANNQSQGLKCRFKNQSEGASEYLWFFGENDYPSKEYHAEHTFRDTGTYPVKLVAIGTGGCTDTLTQMVKVTNHINFNIPNIITPNGDGLNDVFQVKIDGIEKASYYEVIIVDAAGQMVFQSNNFTQVWNGTHQQTGSPCRPGTYFYQISYSFPGENPTKHVGSITLNR